jgi:predicted kinase
MKKPELYLMVGYPGAGKTTTAQIIAKLSRAEHIWADKERRKIFGRTYKPEDSDELYSHLNKRVKQLLRRGKSVIFDTNFNHRRDRDHLKQIADNAGASTKLIWLTTPEDLAYQRAIMTNGGKRLFVEMSHEDFEKVVSHLEPPAEDEHPIKLDGTKISEQYIKEWLGL